MQGSAIPPLWILAAEAHNGCVKAIKATLLAALLCVAVAPAGADQDDERLDALFETLLETEDVGSARETESSIWRIWLEHKDDAVTLLMRDGVAAMNRGDGRAALEDFDQIVKIAPDFAEGWNKRATVHYLLGNYEESLADIAETLDREPRHFGALSGRGLVYSQLEDLEAALDSFEAALEVNPHMMGPRANAEALKKILEGQRI